MAVLAGLAVWGVGSQAVAQQNLFTRGNPSLYQLALNQRAGNQLAMGAAGLPCPRDSDMQESLGDEVTIVEDLSGLRRGDRVHWKGHVGIMLDGERLLHANGFHMLVEAEPLAMARDRIAEAGSEPITTIRRGP